MSIGRSATECVFGFERGYMSAIFHVGQGTEVYLQLSICRNCNSEDIIIWDLKMRFMCHGMLILVFKTETE